ncbi:MAG: hypothetical protein ACQER1_17740 [Armatimonadota bacterium]
MRDRLAGRITVVGRRILARTGSCDKPDSIDGHNAIVQLQRADEPGGEGDVLLWDTARAMALGHGLGDIGSAPGRDVDVDLATECANPSALLSLEALLEDRSEDVPMYPASR